MATISPAVVNPDTYTFTQIESNYNEQKQLQMEIRGKKNQKGIGQLFGQLSRAQLDWQVKVIWNNFFSFLLYRGIWKHTLKNI